MTGIFDTHAHYTSHRFDADRDAVVAALPQGGVAAVVECGDTLTSSAAAVALAHKYPFVHAAVGVHPQECAAAPGDWLERVRTLAADERVVAIGEIGLDYHYDEPARELQKEFFRRQTALANELALPVIVHDRDAHGDVFDILSQLRPRAVIHCFSGSAESARQLCELGFYIGFGGAVTFANNKKAAAACAAVPDEKLLLETDCPYMAPVPHRGERCTSELIAFTAARVGELRGCSAAQIIAMCAANAQRFFGLAAQE